MGNELTQVKKVAVIGAGTMGIGIAATSAMAGFTVIVKDVNEELLARGRKEQRKIIENGVTRGMVADSIARTAVDTLAFTIRNEDLVESDLIIEAVPERFELKRAVFVDIDAIAHKRTVFAANTSSLSVNALASVTVRPDRFIGMHFFNPAHIMRLIEIIGGDDTSEETLSFSVEFLKALGKTPFLCQDTLGFIVNKVARPFYGEALRLLGENAADIETIDLLVKSLGFRMGPFELIDLVGSDVNLDGTKSVYKAHFHDPKYRPPSVAAPNGREWKTGKEDWAWILRLWKLKLAITRTYLYV